MSQPLDGSARLVGSLLVTAAQWKELCVPGLGLYVSYYTLFLVISVPRKPDPCMDMVEEVYYIPYSRTPEQQLV